MRGVAAMPGVAWWGLVGSMALTAGIASAQPSASESVAPLAAVVHRVRASDPLAAEVLRRAAVESETVARLIAQLERSDLVVNIVTGRIAGPFNGHTRVAASTPAVRYVRVSLRIPAATPRLMATLGHELRHAVEIAGMPEVRSDAQLASAYARIGWPSSGDGFFETDAAVETGQQVARELVRRH
ncbi:MAG: hypothetical protein MUE61_07525 [Vicinamibacterales bacterium]|jgi:hypothetical protein|nr:hypothetical protein [Vicinamibacterales bacterium]